MFLQQRQWGAGCAQPLLTLCWDHHNPTATLHYFHFWHLGIHLSQEWDESSHPLPPWSEIGLCLQMLINRWEGSHPHYMAFGEGLELPQSFCGSWRDLGWEEGDDQVKGWVSAVSGVCTVAAVVGQHKRWVWEQGISQQLKNKPAIEPPSVERAAKVSIWVSRDLLWQRANRMLGWANKGITSRDKIIIPLNPALVRRHLEYWGHFWSLLRKKKMWKGWR